MSAFFKIDVRDKDLCVSLQDFFKTLLQSDQIDALLIPWRLPAQNNVMPTLISDPEMLGDADPLAPCFPVNAAKIASRLTKQYAGQSIALVMRPCEVRAFTELIKLKQGTLKDIVIISIDCLGAYSNKDFAAIPKEDAGSATQSFLEHVLDQKQGPPSGIDLSAACKVCEHRVSHTADINICLWGMDYQNSVAGQALTETGKNVMTVLQYQSMTMPQSREEVMASVISEQESRRDEMFEQTSQTVSNIEKLSAYLSRCVNCYNCRVACPVCYCRECVFVTDVFDHDPVQYLKWAQRKGKVKMPTDTTFFHLTRMAHIGLTCVGCGQCSNACPNDIPLMELFRTVAHKAQAAFEYQAGRSIDEPIPFSVFEDKEYEDVVGTDSGETHKISG